MSPFDVSPPDHLNPPALDEIDGVEQPTLTEVPPFRWCTCPRNEPAPSADSVEQSEWLDESRFFRWDVDAWDCGKPMMTSAQVEQLDRQRLAAGK